MDQQQQPYVAVRAVGIVVRYLDCCSKAATEHYWESYQGYQTVVGDVAAQAGTTSTLASGLVLAAWESYSA